jgi:hypothetical protein
MNTPGSERRYLGVSAYRCRCQAYGEEMTVLVVHNPDVFDVFTSGCFSVKNW